MVADFVVGRSMTAKALLPSRIRRIQMCSLVRLLRMCDFTHLFGIILNQKCQTCTYYFYNLYLT